MRPHRSVGWLGCRRARLQGAAADPCAVC